MRTQVAIIGGGPGGSACANHLSTRGISSVIVEKESFPRFHIGESLTEQSGFCLRELGFDEGLLCKKFPVKRAVSIYGPAARNPFFVPVMRRDSEGNLQSTYTWQVRRSDFDRLLLERAQQRGAELVYGRALAPLFSHDGAVHGVSISADSGERFDLECDVLVDASGQGTFLANAGITGPKLPGKYSQQVAIFSHFTDANRDAGAQWGNTLIYFQKKYHWAWFIPLDERVTSIGFVVPSEYFRSRNETTREFLLRELREFNQDLAQRSSDAQFADEVRAASNYSYEVKNFAGKGWLCIGDAHRFIDPLFSFGVSNALTEARYAACAIDVFFKGEYAEAECPFREFEAISDRAVGMCQVVVDAFWENTLSWGMLMSRYREDMIDLLQGHVWDGRSYESIAHLLKTPAASARCT
jgi:flavin-dependent dehydrogenase